MNDEDRQICEAFYSQAIAHATSDEEELAIALHLLEEAELGGAVPDDSGSSLFYINDYDPPVDAEWLIDQEDDLRSQVRRALPILGAMLLAFLVVLLRNGGLGGAHAPTVTPTPTVAVAAVHLATQTLTPVPTAPIAASPTPLPTRSPAATPTSLPTETPSPVSPREVQVQPEPVELDAEAVIPVSLEIAGRYFPVVPTTLRDETWAYLPDPDRASWLAGSYVNVVLGLPYTGENLALLASTLSLSDTLVLRNNAGRANLYQVVDRRQVDVYQIETLSQHRAGLTLVLLGGNDEAPDGGGASRRLVVWAVPIEQAEDEK
jgi:hypothetical protein